MLKSLKNRVAHTLMSSLLISLVACGQADEVQQHSETKVTNGLQASGEYPSVILLQFSTGYSSSICTGTFVNDAQVVTAAHCVYDVIKAGRTASSMSFTKTSANGTTQRVTATALKYHPGYTVVPGRLSKHDLAVVTFPRYSAPATTKLYASVPKVGQTFTIVGFGVNDYRYDSFGQQQGSGSGIKRKGQNDIHQIDNGMIRFYGVPTASDPKTAQGQDVASGSGDSGGPLLINGALAAVTAGGSLGQVKDAGGNTVTVKISNYVDLHESLNHDFLVDNLIDAPVF